MENELVCRQYLRTQRIHGFRYIHPRSHELQNGKPYPALLSCSGWRHLSRQEESCQEALKEDNIYWCTDAMEASATKPIISRRLPRIAIYDHRRSPTTQGAVEWGGVFWWGMVQFHRHIKNLQTLAEPCRPTK